MPLGLGQFPFCYSLMHGKFLSLPNRSIRLCVKGKRINHDSQYGLEIRAEYILYGNEKANQLEKRILDAVDGDGKERVLRCLNKSHFERKSVISYLCFVFSGLSANGT